MIIVVWGVSGCGKTTIAKQLAGQLDWQYLDADDFHPAANIEKMRAGIPLDDEDRRPWLLEIASELKKVNDAGGNATLACSALKENYRQLLGIDEETIRSVLLNGSQPIIQGRLDARRHEFMNKGLLASQLQALESETKGLQLDIEHTPSQICQTIICSFTL